MPTVVLCLAFSAWAYLMIRGFSSWIFPEKKPDTRPWLNGYTFLDDNLEKLPKLSLVDLGEPAVPFATLEAFPSEPVVATEVPNMNSIVRSLEEELLPSLESRQVEPVAEESSLDTKAIFDPQEWIVSESQYNDWD